MREEFSADPTVVFLTAVLSDIREGSIRIPRFQRPLVWKWQQRRDFLDSIFEGLPIGALMIWQTQNKDIGCYTELGPHKLNILGENPEQRYLMDGVQRTSTLIGAFYAEEDWADFDSESDAEVRDFIIYADLDAVPDGEIFYRLIDIEGDGFSEDPSRYLPLNIVLHARDVMRFQRSIPETHEHRIEACEEVVAAFKNYKVPLISLKSASLEVVTRSFERLNSRGAPMSELHMLNALSYSPDFDFLACDLTFRNKYLSPFGWANLDSEVVLRCLKFSLGLDIYSKDPESLSEALDGDIDFLEKVYASIGKSASFFRHNFGIGSPALVPYRMQIVASATCFLQHADRNIEGKLQDWIWFSTYTELFGGPGRQSEDALNIVHSFIIDGANLHNAYRQPPSIRHLSSVRCDFRSARVKAMALALAKKKQDSDGSGLDLLRNHGADAFLTLPQGFGERGKCGYRFLLEPSQAASFKDELMKDELSRSQMKDNFIPNFLLGVTMHGLDDFEHHRSNEIFDYEVHHILEPIRERLGFREFRYIS